MYLKLVKGVADAKVLESWESERTYRAENANLN